MLSWLDKIEIASIMICKKPTILKDRMFISASDSVWSPVEHLDKSLQRYFTDELGNESVDYGGFLQIIDPIVLEKLADHEIYACFRGIESSVKDYVQTCPPKRIYKTLLNRLKFVGWDICTGNGWLSASCHGCFPVNPMTGEEIDKNANQINKFGLFENLDDCRAYCDLNNNEIPEHAPWYPVGVFLDVNSYTRLDES